MTLALLLNTSRHWSSAGTVRMRWKVLRSHWAAVKAEKHKGREAGEAAAAQRIRSPC